MTSFSSHEADLPSELPQIYFIIQFPHANLNLRVDLFAPTFTFVVVYLCYHIFTFSPMAP